MSDFERDRAALKVFQNLASLEGKVNYAFSTYCMGNMSFSYGDHDEVMRSRQRLSTATRIDLKNLVLMVPVHGTKIVRVGETDRGRGVFEKNSGISSTDALVTVDASVALGLNPADCAPVIISNIPSEDPTKPRVLGLAHAGRAGTVEGLVTLVLKEIEALGFRNREQLVVGIGPSISGFCYPHDFIDVYDPQGWEPHIGVYEPYDSYKIDKIDTGEVIKYRFSPSRNGGKLIVDLVGRNVDLITQFGVPLENITASRNCTFCNGEEKKVFSHAVTAQKVSRNKHSYPEGRFMAVAQLKST